MPHLTEYWICHKLFFNLGLCITESYEYFSQTAGKERSDSTSFKGLWNELLLFNDPSNLKIFVDVKGNI